MLSGHRAQDIRQHGLWAAITLYEGESLDGRSRARACHLAGVAPRYEQFSGRDPVAWVLGQNLHRRHLTESQRAMVAAKAKPLFEAEAKSRMLAWKADPSANLREGGKAADQVAKLLNVAPRSVESAAKVIKNGEPGLVKAVSTGQIAVSAAATVASLPKEEQAALVKDGPTTTKAKTKEIKAKKKEERSRSKGAVKIGDLKSPPVQKDDKTGVFTVELSKNWYC